MNTPRKSLVFCLKLLIILSLFAYVFSKIQWHDSLSFLGSESQTTINGQIVGPWNQYPVSFIDTQNQRHLIEHHQADYQINPGFFTYLKQTKPAWLLLGATAFIFVIMFGAIRWHWLVNSQHLNLSISQAIRLTWIGIFFNNFVPGQTGGDLVKAYYIAKNSPQKRITAVLTVFVDRIIGLSALIVISLITATIYFDRFKQIALTLWLGALIGCIVICILFSHSLRQILGLSGLIDKLPSKISEIIENLNTAIKQYQHQKAGLLIWWALSFFSHIINILGIYALSRGINMGVPVIEFFALVPIIFIASAMPIAPNGWGIGEALFGNLFGQFGSVYLPDASNAEQIMSTRGVALSLLYRILSMCLSLIGGLILLLSKDQQYAKIKPHQSTDNST